MKKFLFGILSFVFLPVNVFANPVVGSPEDPMPTPTSTPTATPTPTTTTTQTGGTTTTTTIVVGNSCDKFRFDLLGMGDIDDYRDSQGGSSMIRDKLNNNAASTISLSNAAYNNFRKLDCVKKIYDSCNVGADYNEAQGFEKVYDECIMVGLGDMVSPGFCGAMNSTTKMCIKYDLRCSQSPINNPKCQNGSTTIIVDKDCKATSGKPTDVVADLCGDFNFWTAWSPISLVWSNDRDSEISLVSFPVNPNNLNKAYTWRASKNMPLLVYDIEHSGVIKSGEQLFGNWTWGGKKIASLNSNNIATSAWRDGYEALSQLDSNRNGKVEGIELEPLGLWFDNNQDGISQVGEVVSVKEAGVVTLYYQADRNQPSSKEIVASVGYEKNNNENIVKGKSIDWLADEGESKTELALLNHFNKIAFKQETYLENTNDSLMAKNGEMVVNPELLKKFTGVWSWRISGENKNFKDKVSFGSLVLTLSSESPNEITGHSIIEVPVVNKAGEKRKLISSMPVKGYLEETSSHEYVLKILIHEDNKVLAESSVAYNPERNHLEGKTKNLEDKTGMSLFYNWIAEKM